MLLLSVDDHTSNDQSTHSRSNLLSPVVEKSSNDDGKVQLQKSFLDAFLSKEYINLCVTGRGQQDIEDFAMIDRTIRIQRFFTEGCCFKSILMGAGGGVLGLLFGTFFFSMKTVDVDNTLPFSAQVKMQFRNFFPEVFSSAKNFAKIGLIYSLVECIIERERASVGVANAVYAGCVTGAILAHRAGPIGMLGGCTAFASFSAIMEKLQLFSTSDE